MNDLEKEYGTSSTLRQALCIISGHQLIREFKLEFQSGNVQFAGVKIDNFLSHVTLTFDE